MNRTWTPVVVSLLVLGAPALARAEDAPAAEADTWSSRFEAARVRMEDGDYVHAELELRALAATAPNEADRRVATELADVCSASEKRRANKTDVTIRTTDELWVGYGHAFLYGLGTGTWFAFQVHPGILGGLLLPMVGFSAASIGGLALADALHPLPYGMPHAISTGLEVGLVEGTWIALAQRAHATHSEAQVWHAETTSSLLWGTATAGGIAGGLVGAVRATTPGRAAFVGSLSLWTGTLFALGSATLSPDTTTRAEHAFVAGDVGYNSGLLASLLVSPIVSPSVARVRWIDLGGLGGALLGGGIYSLATQGDGSPRASFASAGVGAALGLGTAIVLTRNMPRDLASSHHGPMVHPIITPTAGGMTVSLGGQL